MIGIPKVMIFFFYYIKHNNVLDYFECFRYNFVIEKRTNQLNILAAEIDPSIPMAKVFYFKELNCNKVNLSWDYQRVLNNLKFFSYNLSRT